MNEGIRDKVSRLLGLSIPAGKWESYMGILDRDGVPNRKQLIGLVLIICQQIEILENDVANRTRSNKNFFIQSVKK
jgi:hypothetical protein